MVSFSSIPSASSVFSAYASLSASITLFKTMVNQILPHQVQSYIFSTISYYFTPRSSMITLTIEERDGMPNNEVYDSAEIYLNTKVTPSIERLRISKRPKDCDITVKFGRCDKIFDFFEGIELVWSFVCEDREKKKRVSEDESGGSYWESERRFFELTFDKKYKDQVLKSYVPFVIKQAQGIKDGKKIVKLHTVSCTYNQGIWWDSINLEHPSTFETVAMESDMKRAIIEDLDRFVRRKDFYRKVGKAWKRGYLLYGPPGTGKSSLIAAIANYLKFDIYDLELTNIKRNADLRKILLRTASRSIVVIEDIDCSVELPDRNGVAPTLPDGRPPRDSQFTLSGLLNFIDGLWSSCGDERIIIFTTNNKDKLDPALLRPGRMDMHIHMSYLTTEGFKVLASNYLDLQDDDLDDLRFREIEELIQGMNVTPAEVAEELMKSDDADICLEGLANFLKSKKMKMDEQTDQAKQAVSENVDQQSSVEKV